MLTRRHCQAQHHTYYRSPTPAVSDPAPDPSPPRPPRTSAMMPTHYSPPKAPSAHYSPKRGHVLLGPRAVAALSPGRSRLPTRRVPEARSSRKHRRRSASRSRHSSYRGHERRQRSSSTSRSRRLEDSLAGLSFNYSSFGCQSFSYSY